MFYIIGYEKKEGDEPKYKVTLDLIIARKTYDKFKNKYHRVCILQYGATSDDYIPLAEAENGNDVELSIATTLSYLS